MLKMKTHQGMMIGGVVLFFMMFFAFFRLGYLFTQPLNVPEEGYEFIVEPGNSLNHISATLSSQKILTFPSKLLSLYGQITGASRLIQAGEYRVQPGMTAVDVMEMLRYGKVIQYTMTFIEGWSVHEVLNALQLHPKVTSTLQQISPDALLTAIERPGHHPEGLFYPDTYHFTAATSDKEILQRAYDAMRERLMKLWQGRAPQAYHLSPYQTLIMASIVEKETALIEEMPKVSGVYLRRLSKGMPLQADPTVIYGMGDTFGGQLMSQDLKYASPYNTYLHRGLPPTPIAMPSLAAIYATLHPHASEDLYFVADGTGGHVFSKTYEAHQVAVAKLKLLRKQQKEQ